MIKFEKPIFSPAIKIICLCLLLLAGYHKKVYGQTYGLEFSSYDVVQDKRTSLDLSPGVPFDLSDGFELSFDVSFVRNQTYSFGYLVRIIAGDQQNIDLIYNGHVNKDRFAIVKGDKFSNIKFDIPESTLFSQWNNISLKFDIEKDELVLYNGNRYYIEKNLGLKRSKSYKILFGANNYKQYQTTDVPPFKLKDVKLSQNGSLKYTWPLNEMTGNTAHEQQLHKDALVSNPVWIKAKHRYWKAAQPILINGNASVAFDAAKGLLYVVASDSLHTYTVDSDRWSSDKYLSGAFVLNQGNQSLFDPRADKIYNIFEDQKTVTSYNIKTHRWNKAFLFDPTTYYWQPNKLLSQNDTAVYVLGGYGHRVYKNNIQKFSLATSKWSEIKPHGDFFMPRYLAALGASKMGDTVYLLGGYGSSSGEQVLNPRNTYDMLRFTVKDKTFKKLYDLKATGDDFAFANSMIVDKRSNSFFALSFNQHKYNSALQMINGSLSRPDYELVGEPIPYKFNDTRSYADLYYYPSTKSFIAVTLLRTDNGKTEVGVFTLLGPPLAMEDATVVKVSTHQRYGLFGGVVLLLVIAGSAWVIRSKKIPAVTQEQPLEPRSVNEKPVETEVVMSENNPKSDKLQAFDQTQQYRNAILLFGDLQIFDSEGVNITKEFTPLGKELFLIILLYSIRWGRGISTEKLNEIFWNGKSARNARNNRSVNFIKLKNLLDRIGHYSLERERNCWKMDFEYDHIYVDYHSYLNIVKDKDELDIAKIKRLSDIIRRGNFLSLNEYDWLDEFKSEISNEVIDTFLHFVQANEASLDPELLIEIASFIFYFDPVNEDAMIIKCKALSTLGKHSLARQAFEAFAKNYKNIYDVDFKKDFNSVIL